MTNGSDTWGPENPCFYQTTINIAALMGTANKPLASITFGKAIAQSTAVYAVSGLPAGDAPAPGLPVAATGWNRDLVVEKTASGPPFASYAAELNPGEGKAYYQAGLPGYSYGFPASGSFASQVDGTVFQFQPYTGNNALMMSSDTGISAGTLTLATPAVYNSLSVIANSGGGGGTPSVTIHFADGTTYTTNFNAQDWFLGTLNIALAGFERIDLATGVTEGAPANPRLYQTSYDLAAIFGVTNKPITSLVFNQATGAGATAIYAVSGVAGNQTNGQYIMPVVADNPASGVQTRAATMNGTVVSTGGAAPEVFIYYGSTDGGTNAANWNHRINLGLQTGAFAETVDGLAVNANYYYRVAAINPAGVAWAPATQSFTTANATLSDVTNQPAANVGPNSAILSGNVLSTGGDAPVVTLYYGQGGRGK